MSSEKSIKPLCILDSLSLHYSFGIFLRKRLKKSNGKKKNIKTKQNTLILERGKGGAISSAEEINKNQMRHWGALLTSPVKGQFSQ